MSFQQSQHCHPTAGQIERNISQKINALYHSQISHRAKKIDCHLFDDKIIIFCEEVITPIEKLLLEESSFDLAHQIRTCLDSLLKTKIENLIEKIVQTKVDNCIYTTSIKTNSSVGIFILENAVQVRVKSNSRRSNRKNVVQFDRSENQCSESG